MQQVNYQETVVIPTLQKKLQDLQSANLVLEVSLMVEQTKFKDFQSYHQKVVSEQDTKVSNSIDLKNKINTISDENAKNVRTIESMQQELNIKNEEILKLKTNLQREISIKESVMNEYNIVKNELEIEKSKTKKPVVKKKKEEEVMLDGETY